jgi:hypothetical protein
MYSATSNNVLDKAIDAEDEIHHDFLRLVHMLDGNYPNLFSDPGNGLSFRAKFVLMLPHTDVGPR